MRRARFSSVGSFDRRAVERGSHGCEVAALKSFTEKESGLHRVRLKQILNISGMEFPGPQGVSPRSRVDDS